MSGSTRTDSGRRAARVRARDRVVRESHNARERGSPTAGQRGMTAGSGRRASGRTGRCAPGERTGAVPPPGGEPENRRFCRRPHTHRPGGEYGPPARPVTTTQPPPRGANGRERRRTSVVPARPATCGLASPIPSTTGTLPARRTRYGHRRRNSAPATPSRGGSRTVDAEENRGERAPRLGLRRRGARVMLKRSASKSLVNLFFSRRGERAPRQGPNPASGARRRRSSSLAPRPPRGDSALSSLKSGEVGDRLFFLVSSELRLSPPVLPPLFVLLWFSSSTLEC